MRGRRPLVRACARDMTATNAPTPCARFRGEEDEGRDDYVGLNVAQTPARARPGEIEPLEPELGAVA